jgi:hypothetical protein
MYNHSLPSDGGTGFNPKSHIRNGVVAAMANTEGSADRPTWVRLVIPRGTDRQASKIGLLVSALLVPICLTTAGLESNRDTQLARIAFVISIVGSLLSTALAIWHWRARSWLDQHGGWPKRG